MNQMDVFEIPIDLRKKETLESQISVYLKQYISQKSFPKGTILPRIETLSEFNAIDAYLIETVYFKLVEDGYIKHINDRFIIDKIQLKVNYLNQNISPLKAIKDSGFEATFKTIKHLNGVRVPNDFNSGAVTPIKPTFEFIRNVYFANLVPLFVVDYFVPGDDLKRFKTLENIDFHGVFIEDVISLRQNIMTVKKVSKEILDIFSAPKDSGLIQNDGIQFDENNTVLCVRSIYANPNYAFKTSTHFN